MVIGLIGMSGVGKSSWAARLAQGGFTTYDCDELIAERLRAEHGADTVSVYDIGRWMGFPYESRYAERERIYLEYEHAVLADIIERVDPQLDVVVDMTGSVVYLDPALLARLSDRAVIVYLQAAPELHTRLLNDYLDQPRPVIWNGMFQPYPGEDPLAALVRCYPVLLGSRAERYARLARVAVDSRLHRDPAFGVADLLSYACGVR